MRIYLIGYMGSGKSTLGRQLAAMLNLTFIDLDTYLENKYFKTVPQIFAEEGEESFRKKEQAALREVSEFSDVIVATGGGAPCFFDNMALMNETGACVFLDVDYEELADRLMGSKTERPLIKGKSRAELLVFIDELMQKRRPFYEKAHIIVRGKNITAQQVLDAIAVN